MIKMSKKQQVEIKNKAINEDVKRLVIARIQAASKKGDLGVIVGSDDIKKTNIIKSIQEENEVGIRIVEAHINFLKAMASGEIYQDE